MHEEKVSNVKQLISVTLHTTYSFLFMLFSYALLLTNHLALDTYLKINQFNSELTWPDFSGEFQKVLSRGWYSSLIREMFWINMDIESYVKSQSIF